tara:strand:+ start:308 stop:550 length:243 start_codon:yes stop_codon:yes gene_type:complete
LIEMHHAIIKRSAKDLGHEKSEVRASAAGWFMTDSFKHFCSENAIPYERWMESVGEIVKQEGVRKKKLINEFLKEITDYL